MLLSKKSDVKIDICYHYRKPESGCLVIYNMGKSKLANLKVILANEKGQSFDYVIPKISLKTGELIKYTTEKAQNGSLFSGELKTVRVEIGQTAFYFVVDENYNFRAK
jgi:hypothetical protein